MLPLVSVIIPSYNHKKYLLELLNSIRNQTYPEIEIVIIDDGSTDGSVELLQSVQEKYQLKLITKSNEGLCATANLGLEIATGDYIVLIASDDFMPPKRIEEQVMELSKSPFDAIAGGMTIVNENSEFVKYRAPLRLGEVSFEEMLHKNLIAAPSVMFKAITFKKYGRYNASHSIEDYSMWLHILSQNGRLANLNYNWVFYRVNHALTRKKIDWYFNGLVEVLGEYKSNPIATKSLQNNRFKYLIKTALFEGLDASRKLKLGSAKSNLPSLSPAQTVCVYLVIGLPRFVRKALLKKIFD
ncbi:MAG: glycosyltransferase [Sideroxydans sp.]|nr:glycosyltransferase [Sideroxydans sp.]